MLYLVTGVSSFVGMHLAVRLAKHHPVIGTFSQDRQNYEAIRQQRLNYAEKMGVQLKSLDLTDHAKLKTFITQYKPTVWFHHAAWAKDYASPHYDMIQARQINIEPLEPIYATLKENGALGIIVTGTNAEYGESSQAHQEKDICNPNTPYGKSKLAETDQAHALALKYQLKTRIARLFIPYGTYDNPKKLLPNVIQALQNHQSIDLSPCKQQRDFLYIDDVILAFEKLISDLNRDLLFDIFNICHGQATTLKEFLLTIGHHLNADTHLLKFGQIPMRSTETLIDYGNNEKARKMLNWQPQPMDQAIKKFLK